MKNKKFFQRNPFIISIIIAISFILGLVISVKKTPTEKPEYTGVIWPNPPRVSEFTMLNSYEKEITETFLEGTWNLIFFGFTHCPDICPSTLSTLSIAEQTLRGKKIFDKSNIIFISIDTHRDDPNLIRRYLSNFSNSFIGMTGEESELKKLGDSLGAVFYHRKMNDGKIIIDHSSSLFILSPENELLGVLTQPFSSKDVVEKYEKLREFHHNQLN